MGDELRRTLVPLLSLFSEFQPVTFIGHIVPKFLISKAFFSCLVKSSAAPPEIQNIHQALCPSTMHLSRTPILSFHPLLVANFPNRRKYLSKSSCEYRKLRYTFGACVPSLRIITACALASLLGRFMSFSCLLPTTS